MASLKEIIELIILQLQKSKNLPNAVPRAKAPAAAERPAMY
jgi:hypothetical protein